MVKDTDKSKHGRRKLLKMCGIGLGISTISAGTTQASPEYHIKLRGTVSNPVSTKAIEHQRNALIKRYRNQQDGSTSFSLTVPSHDDGAIVAYNFIIRESGEPREHYLRIDSDELSNSNAVSHSERHSRADMWLVDDPGKVTQNSKVKQGDATTTSTKDDYSDWNDRGSAYDEIENPPYGILIKDYELKSDPDTNAQVVKTACEMEAGKQRARHGDPSYDERWQNKEAVVIQNWNQSNYNNEMRDRYPRGNPSNEKNEKNITLSADPDTLIAAVGLKYSQPESEVIDDSSQFDEISRHKLKNAPGGDPAKHTAYYTPSAYTKVNKINDDCDRPKQYVLVDIELTGVWADTNFLNQWVNPTPEKTTSTQFLEYC